MLQYIIDNDFSWIMFCNKINRDKFRLRIGLHIDQVGLYHKARDKND